MTYRGRFAPSPTGPLHFGSLVAALGSYLDARRHQGEWLVRIEDLDKPREMPGAADAILRTLEAFGLYWDEEPVYQSRRSEAYEAALEQLRYSGQTYPCSCSRKQIILRCPSGPEGAVYDRHCRLNGIDVTQPQAQRLLVADRPVKFTDLILGEIEHKLSEQVGDFILKRRDGLYAYQLAVVVDDAWQDISHVVRGGDLLLSTPRQRLLQQHLKLPELNYAHLPLALDENGKKLSKQYNALPVDPEQPMPALYAALKHLGQALPASADAIEQPRDLLAWAVNEWRLDKVPGTALQAGETASERRQPPTATPDD